MGYIISYGKIRIYRYSVFGPSQEVHWKTDKNEKMGHFNWHCRQQRQRSNKQSASDSVDHEDEAR